MKQSEEGCRQVGRMQIGRLTRWSRLLGRPNFGRGGKLVECTRRSTVHVGRQENMLSVEFRKVVFFGKANSNERINEVVTGE